MTIRALIVDDEMHCRENLAMLIQEYCPDVEIIASASDAASALLLIEEHHPDLVFLDIMMPKTDGFGLLENIENRTFSVVFTTAHSEFALKAFRSNALDYLQKPIDISELEQAVAKVRDRLAIKTDAGDVVSTIRKVLGEMGIGSGNEEMAVPTRDGLEVVRYDDILRLEASESYTTIYLSDGRKFISSRTIKVYEDHLPENQFCRVHKAHLINMKFLKGYNRTEGHMAVMKNGDLIPVSRRKLSILLDRIQPF